MQTPNVQSSRYRLGRSVIPLRYDLTLTPNLDDSRFEGVEEIEIEIREGTEAILLNAVELQIATVWLLDHSGRRIEVSSIDQDEESERVRLSFSETIEAGNCRLHIEFAGALNDKLRGFYRSRYTDEAGETHIVAATQFEATDARRAFPCFDEPDLKAVFAITLKISRGLSAFSNSPALSNVIGPGGSRIVSFADTIRMSTYLVAFVIGPLEATDPVDAGGIPVRVIHPVGQGSHTSFALDVACFSLQFFGDYYGIPYPGEKLDLVAMPDFAMGAMENFGCVTFRETLLLVDPDSVTQSELRTAALVIAHELAHMWFGDLVTMRWWNGIWLNEAFATFMEHAAVDAYRPEWRTWTHFSLSRSAAFRVDALGSTRPIEYPVESPADAEGMFDVLTYEKGASVLRMLEQYLGPDSFRDGIRAYLKKYSYSNTETGDLWSALEEATSQPVERIMTSWVFQPGFPHIRIERSSDRKTLRLSQERFRFAAAAEDPVQRWAVPLVLRIGNGDRRGSDHRVLLEGGETGLSDSDSVDWVVGNVDANGYYRVSYGSELLAGLSARLFDRLTPIERFAMLDDRWASLLSGDTTAESFFELTRAFWAEESVDVWHTLSGCFAHLSRLVEGDALARLRAAICRVAGGALAKIGWEASSAESQEVKELRGVLVETLCITGADNDAIARARVIHDRSFAEPSSVEPNLAAAALGAVASVGTPQDHEHFAERAQVASSPQERLRYLYALASFPGATEIDRTLALTLSGEVRTQNAPYLIGSCLRNRYHGNRAWKFIRENWERINSTFPPNTIARMLAGVRAVDRPETAAEIDAFFSTHPVPQGKLMLEQHLELMRVNVALKDREAGRFSEYLLRNQADRS